MCKCAAICAFDSDRAPDFSLYRKASHRGFILEWVRSRDGDEEAAQLLIDNYFLKFLLCHQNAEKPRVMNYVDLLPNGKFILTYCFVTTDWTASVEGRRKHATPWWLWPWWASAAVERLLHTAQPHPISVHSICLYNFLSSLSFLAEAFPLYTVIPNLLVQIKYVCSYVCWFCLKTVY